MSRYLRPEGRDECPPILTRQIPSLILANIQIPSCLYKQFLRNPYVISKCSKDSPFFVLFQAQLFPGDEDAREKTHGDCLHFQSLSLEEQLKSFVNAQLLTTEQLRLRWQLAFDVLYNLRFYYPHCEVYAFGSLLTGLGDVNSDVDLYIDLFADDGAFLQGHRAKVLAERKISDDLKAILKYSKCPHTGNYFAVGVRCLGTRIPVLRFYHKGSNKVQCDISFGTRLSVQNSKLLLFYLNYDPRIGPFLVFLRYWAKFHGISGETKIKQYALSLLAVCYLTKKKFIPSVHLLQTLAGEERAKNGVSKNPDEFEGWDSSFCEDTELINKYFKANSVPLDDNHASSSSEKFFLEMVLEFFEMFAFLDLSSVFICTLGGLILEKSTITNGKGGEELPECLKGKEKALRIFYHNRPLCIQDPFVLSFNVGGVAKKDVVSRFQKACKVTYEKLAIGGGDQVNSLLDLFIRLHEKKDNQEG